MSPFMLAPAALSTAPESVAVLDAAIEDESLVPAFLPELDVELVEVDVVPVDVDPDVLCVAVPLVPEFIAVPPGFGADAGGPGRDGVVEFVELEAGISSVTRSKSSPPVIDKSPLLASRVPSAEAT